MKPVAVSEVEPGEAFRCDDEAMPSLNAFELGYEIGGELAVTMADEPDIGNLPGGFVEGLVASSLGNAKMVFHGILL
jgi:hypothetical protein